LFTFITKYQIPSNLDWFGWCTWDAFYKAVNPSGIEEGLQRFAGTNVSLENGNTHKEHLLPHFHSYHLLMMHFMSYSLREGGVPPRFLIIDDGWQETVDEIKEVDEALREQTVLVFHPLVIHKSVHSASS
jgi:hypothetical protein